MSQKTTRSIFDDVADEDDSAAENMRWRKFRLWKDRLRAQWSMLTDDRLVVMSIIVIAFFIGVALFAPYLAPHDPTERQYQDDGVLISQWMEPTFVDSDSDYVLGTTSEGYDIFSQLIYGSRIALLVGLLSALFTAGIGTAVGLIAGYYGGYVDDVLMRIVDFLYGLPLLPSVILLVALLGPSIWNLLLAIALLQWRSTARVIRSQVLSLRTRPFVKAARVAGASDRHIIIRHLAPNVMPLAFLYGAFAIAWAILTEAGVSFLGMGDPNHISWGVMLESAKSYQALPEGAWWWFIPPGICISLVVISGFLIGRGYEQIVNPELRIE